MEQYGNPFWTVKVKLIKGEKGDKGDGSYDDTEIRQLLVSHTHDDRYYTEQETDAKIASVNDKLGTGSLDTASQTIIPAINEVHDEFIDSLPDLKAYAFFRRTLDFGVVEAHGFTDFMTFSFDLSNSSYQRWGKKNVGFTVCNLGGPFGNAFSITQTPTWDADTGVLTITAKGANLSDGQHNLTTDVLIIVRDPS